MSSYEETLKTTKVGTFTITSRLVNDEDVECPINPDYCAGSIYLFERGGYGRNADIHEAYKDDPMAVPVQLYEHSGRVWSVATKDPQCQFDTTPLAGYWVCDWACKENYDDILTEKGEVEARKWLLEAARIILEEYTSWAEGDCWGVVIDVTAFDGDDPGQFEAVWGYIGRKYAEEELEIKTTYAIHYFDTLMHERAERLDYWINHYGEPGRIWGQTAHRYLAITSYIRDTPQHTFSTWDDVASALEHANTMEAGALITVLDLDIKGEHNHGERVPFTTGYVLAKKEATTP